MLMTENVDISLLKEKALKLRDPIKTIILSQPDSMDKNILITKAQEWLKMLDLTEKVDQ
jgi:hypothetical protein